MLFKKIRLCILLIAVPSYIQPTDVLLFSGNINSKAPNTAGDIVDIILQLLKEGKITKQQIDASYKRIIRMKNERKNLQMFRSCFRPLPWFVSTQNITK
jgi:hypothetical protein